MSDEHQNCYELLEVDPGASQDQIRRNFKRLSALFDPDSPVVYGLYRPEEARRLLADLREAHRILTDTLERRRHDRRLFPEGHPSLRRADERSAAPAPAPRPPMEDPFKAAGISEDTLLCGVVLAKLRAVQGLSLADIADRTKISLKTLEAIEADDYAALPAVIYVRSFLKQVAALLHLDPNRVVDDYLVGYEAGTS